MDPQGTAERAAAAEQDRAVWLRIDDGTPTAGLGGSWLPAADAVAAWRRIDTLARTHAGDGRTLDQRRADTFLDLLRGGTGDTNLPPVAVNVELVVSAETLHGGDAPGELAEVGPIPAPSARTLAYTPGSQWRRLVTDPGTGWLTACGETLYQPGAWEPIYTDPVEPVPGKVNGHVPTPRIRRYVKARDRRCSFPGCTRRAHYGDLDHTIPWPRGDTEPGNLHPLCRRHHRLKTHDKRWELDNNDDGTWTWVTPAGRRYTKTPYDYRLWR